MEPYGWIVFLLALFGLLIITLTIYCILTFLDFYDENELSWKFYDGNKLSWNFWFFIILLPAIILALFAGFVIASLQFDIDSRYLGKLEFKEYYKPEYDKNIRKKIDEYKKIHNDIINAYNEYISVNILNSKLYEMSQMKNNTEEDNPENPEPSSSTVE